MVEEHVEFPKARRKQQGNIFVASGMSNLLRLLNDVI